MFVNSWVVYCFRWSFILVLQKRQSTHFGSVVLGLLGRMYDICNKIDQVRQELGVHLFRDIYPVRKSRIDNAEEYRNEKENALTVTNDFVLVNSLGHLSLNQSSIEKCSVKSLGSFICASDVNSIEHSHVVFVENLAVMANLSLLNIP